MPKSKAIFSFFNYFTGLVAMAYFKAMHDPVKKLSLLVGLYSL